MTSIKKLRIAGMIEGTTLLALLFIAVPLKHLSDMPQVVSVVGPIHGIAFLAYLRFLIVAVAEGGWPRSDIIRTAIVSFIPLGTFYNDQYLKKMEQSRGFSS